MKQLLLKLSSVFISGLVIATASYGQTFIKPTGAGTQDGTSWDNAKGADDLHAAIMAKGTIYVAAGTYPQNSPYNFSSESNFSLRVIGGFPADVSGTDTSGYNPIANETIFSGAPAPASSQFNLSTIQNVNLELRGLIFTGKSGASHGYWFRSTTMNGNCHYLFKDLKIVDNNVIVNGDGSFYFGTDGGPNNLFTFENCYFANNRSHNGAGIMFATINNSIIKINNCSFVNNISTATGGGALMFTTVNNGTAKLPSNVLISNSSFCGNSTTTVSDEGGGAIYATTAKIAVDNCIFFDNTAIGGSAPNGGAIFGTTAIVHVDNSTFINNSASAGGAIFVRASYIGGCSHFNDSYFYGNSTTNNSSGAAEGGGAIYMYDGHYEIQRSVFVNNEVPADAFGGAVRHYASDDITPINNSIFYNNKKGTSTVLNGSDISNYNGVDKISLANNRLQLSDAPSYSNQAGASNGYVFGGDNIFDNTMDPDGLTSYDCPANIKTGKASIKLFLQGAAEVAGAPVPAGMMRNDLQIKGLLPTTDPYFGTTNYADINDESGLAGDIVDWIKVEVRRAANPATVLETKVLLLQTDGSIVDVNGQSPFFSTMTETTRLAVHHRNHLSILSVDIPANQLEFTYDFTTDLSKAHALSFDPQQQLLVNTKFSIIAGNNLYDYYTDFLDMDKLATSIRTFPFDVYDVNDLNLDGIVDFLDASLLSLLINNFYYSTLLNY